MPGGVHFNVFTVRAQDDGAELVGPQHRGTLGGQAPHDIRLRVAIEVAGTDRHEREAWRHGAQKGRRGARAA